jgi:hypothetical protein
VRSPSAVIGLCAQIGACRAPGSEVVALARDALLGALSFVHPIAHFYGFNRATPRLTAFSLTKRCI